MMRPCKKIAVCFLAVFLAPVLAACGAGDPGEFASQQSFEYHFFPEEYEEEYSEYEKTIWLEENTEYQFQVNAVCDDGTMEIRLTGENLDAAYTVDASHPCRDQIRIPANTAETACFAISLNPDTKGDVAVEVATRQA